MEKSDRKEGSNKSNDARSSSEDESSVDHQASGKESHPNQEGLYYSSHVASVCHAINSQVERAMSPFEQQMLQKRRETNRLSARKRRKRKGDEIKRLEEEKHRLLMESQQLIAEKARLQATLQIEWDATFPGNARDGAPFQRHVVAPWAPHNDPPPLLQLLQQQAQLPQQFSSNMLTTVDPSIGPFARPMSTRSAFDFTTIENLANFNRDNQRTMQQPHILSLDVLPGLAFPQGNQAGVSPLVQNPTVAPQTQSSHSISNPEFANNVSAIAVALAVLHRQPENSHNSSEASQFLAMMNPYSPSSPNSKETK